MRFLLSFALILFCCSCANQSTGRVQPCADFGSDTSSRKEWATVKTYADLEAAVRRYEARYQRSQLTSRPARSLRGSDLSDKLFYQLPLSERVVCIMDSFARVELDGEYGFEMFVMLSYSSGRGSFARNPPTAADRAYTKAIFQTIDGFSEEQIREFCLGFGEYSRFQKNLKRWRARCIEKMPER